MAKRVALNDDIAEQVSGGEFGITDSNGDGIGTVFFFSYGPDKSIIYESPQYESDDVYSAYRFYNANKSSMTRSELIDAMILGGYIKKDAVPCGYN